MSVSRSKFLRIVWIAALVTLAAILGSACARTEDPFDIGARKELKEGTPTVGTQASAADPTQPVATPHPDDLLAIGTVRMATWDDKTINLENMLAGYIIAHGFSYEVELAETPRDGYHDALSTGQVDVVLEMPRTAAPEWYRQQTRSGAVIDVGSLLGPDSDVRIGVHSGLKERAPDVVAFLEKLSLGKEQLAELAARITGGFVAIKPNVAALMYLKSNRDDWSQWVPPSVAANVDSAIERGKASLRRGRCHEEDDGGCRAPGLKSSGIYRPP